MVDVVGDQDDAEAAIARLGDQAQHDGGLVDAERRGRLVEDQDLGAEMHRPGDRQHCRSPPDSVPTACEGSRTSMPIASISSWRSCCNRRGRCAETGRDPSPARVP